MKAVAIEFKFPEWEKKLKAARAEVNIFIAAQMQFNRGMLFDQEGAYNGHPKWAPLKFRVGQILKLNGTLSKSMGPMGGDGSPGPDGIVRFEGDTITIGTNLAYAQLMNDGTSKMAGGVLRPTGGDQAIAIPLPSGKNATDYAKSLRKGSSTKKDFAKRIGRLEAEISIMKGAGKKAEAAVLMEKLERWKTKYEASPKDQRVIFRKSVKIPARPFDQWNGEDQADLEAALVNKIAEILNR